MNPLDSPELYDAIVLAGRRSPGRARLTVAKRSYGWDEQKAKGNDGAETVKNGSSLVKFSCELFLWNDGERDCFAEWEAWKGVLDTTVDPKSPKALDVYHPELDELGVRSVVVQSRGALHPDGKGGATVTIDFLEYAPARKAPGGKPGGSKSSTFGGLGGLSDSLFGESTGRGETRYAENEARRQHERQYGTGGAGPKPPDPKQDLKDEVASLTDTFQAA